MGSETITIDLSESSTQSDSILVNVPDSSSRSRHPDLKALIPAHQ